MVKDSKTGECYRADVGNIPNSYLLVLLAIIFMLILFFWKFFIY